MNEISTITSDAKFLLEYDEKFLAELWNLRQAAWRDLTRRYPGDNLIDLIVSIDNLIEVKSSDANSIAIGPKATLWGHMSRRKGNDGLTDRQRTILNACLAVEVDGLPVTTVRIRERIT